MLHLIINTVCVFTHEVTSQTATPTIMARCLVSKIFIPTLRMESEATATSHKLLLRAGLIRQTSAGIYSYLPLAVKSLQKLERLIDEEMTAIDGTKLACPSLAPAQLWKESGRWNAMGGELWRIKDRKNVDFCLGPTHEEIVSSLMASELQSYKQLPLRLYQTTTKFRDEMRPRSGLLRSREFIMKDMYTFDVSEEAAKTTYELVCEAYGRILKRLDVPFIKAEGDVGQIGGSMSHEFHIPAECGEDHVIVCTDCKVSVNQAIMTQDNSVSSIRGCQLATNCRSHSHKAIEVGHAFYLGTKYSEVFRVTFTDDNREKRVAEMGCFGIGVSRLLQACIEALSPPSGDQIIWPTQIAPYKVCIVPIDTKEDNSAHQLNSLAETLYDTLNDGRVPVLDSDVIIDDRMHLSVGVRLADAALVGYPMLVVLGSRTIENGLIELQHQYSGETEYLTFESLVAKLQTFMM